LHRYFFQTSQDLNYILGIGALDKCRCYDHDPKTILVCPLYNPDDVRAVAVRKSRISIHVVYVRVRLAWRQNLWLSCAFSIYDFGWSVCSLHSTALKS